MDPLCSQKRIRPPDEEVLLHWGQWPQLCQWSDQHMGERVGRVLKGGWFVVMEIGFVYCGMVACILGYMSRSLE